MATAYVVRTSDDAWFSWAARSYDSIYAAMAAAAEAKAQGKEVRLFMEVQLELD